MKVLLTISLIVIFYHGANTQHITAATPAKLQVYAMTTLGDQQVMHSEHLAITFDQLKMTGELKLSSLITEDILLKNVLDSAEFDLITLSGLIPEGQFVFQNTMNSKFTVETDIVYGDRQSRALISYDISNRKTSSSNTFDISCTGSISLRDNLGVTRETGLEDKVSFQYFLNVQTKTF
jgi:hypothetical protein